MSVYTNVVLCSMDIFNVKTHRVQYKYKYWTCGLVQTYITGYQTFGGCINLVMHMKGIQKW